MISFFQICFKLTLGSKGENNIPQVNVGKHIWIMQNICHMWTNLLANNIDPDSLVQTAWHAGASLNKWHMVLGIVAKSCFSKIRFSEANIHSNFKGIRFNSIHRFQFV